MKLLKMFLLFVAVMGTSVAITSCGGHSHDNDSSEKLGKEYTSDYVCPMHCKDSGSEKAGKCPVCGMDYVVNEDHKKDGHEHSEDVDHDHDDHEHGDDDGHNH